MQTDGGPAVGTVVRGRSRSSLERRRPAADSPHRVVRLATHDDIVARAQASAARARSVSRRDAEDPRARPADEAHARRAGVRRIAAGLLLHGRRARRFPRAGPRAGRRSSARASRCGRSACATRRSCSAATARAAGRCAARRFSPSFEPVSIKMAKQQDLSLNPSKLSGLCGRLKCCLRYELPNAKGQVHGGCGSEGGCDNPSGCGTGWRAARAAAVRAAASHRSPLEMTQAAHRDHGRRPVGHRSGDCRGAPRPIRPSATSASRSSTARRPARRFGPAC